ncbi:MAG: superoxide dismutase [Spirochaetales bacterium]|nr:superoxide dismutase [Spirochaetales bacterium]
MPFTLPKLPYDFNALEPAIDAKTMEIHWGKHHQAYINNANTALENTEFASWSVDEVLRGLAKIPADKQTVLRNNAGGHINHSFFWEILTPAAKSGKPTGKLNAGIDSLGGFDKFKADFSKAALSRFGSGWAWLAIKPDKTLQVYSTANQDSPLLDGLKPIIGLDVWEHAYYLKYQNRRAEYIEAFFSVINWGKVNEIYEEELK